MCFFCFTEEILNLPFVLKPTERPQMKRISTADHTQMHAQMIVAPICILSVSRAPRVCWEKYKLKLVGKRTSSAFWSLWDRWQKAPGLSEEAQVSQKMCRELAVCVFLRLFCDIYGLYWVTGISTPQKLSHRIENIGKHWYEKQLPRKHPSVARDKGPWPSGLSLKFAAHFSCFWHRKPHRPPCQSKSLYGFTIISHFFLYSFSMKIHGR